MLPEMLVHEPQGKILINFVVDFCLEFMHVQEEGLISFCLAGKFSLTLIFLNNSIFKLSWKFFGLNFSFMSKSVLGKV